MSMAILFSGIFSEGRNGNITPPPHPVSTTDSPDSPGRSELQIFLTPQEPTDKKERKKIPTDSPTAFSPTCTMYDIFDFPR